MWVVSENHSTATAAFRKPLPCRGINLNNRSRFRQFISIANSGYRTRYPTVAATILFGWADHAHRAAHEHVGIDHCGVCNGLLLGLLDQTWIVVVTALLCRGEILPAVSLGKHPLPARLPIGTAVLPRQGMGQHYRSPPRRQTLLMEAVNN